MKTKEIKVCVTFTPGYEERFTKACVEAAIRRLENEAEAAKQE